MVWCVCFAGRKDHHGVVCVCFAGRKDHHGVVCVFCRKEGSIIMVWCVCFAGRKEVSSWCGVCVLQVENLAIYSDLPGHPPAVVKATLGNHSGTAILCSPHVEFPAFQLNPADKYLMKIQRELRNSERTRDWFFRSLLKEAGLSVRVHSLL
jgi:hypothetical protein